MSELTVFLGMLWCGVAIGILFDLLRPLNMICRARLYHATLDVLFYAVSGAFAAATLVWLNGGVLRLYAVIACFIGIFAQQRTVSVLLRSWLSKKACQHNRYVI